MSNLTKKTVFFVSRPILYIFLTEYSQKDKFCVKFDISFFCLYVFWGVEEREREREPRALAPLRSHVDTPSVHGMNVRKKCSQKVLL